MEKELGATINDENSDGAAIRQQKERQQSEGAEVEDGGRITRERVSE